jgi:hypothetical protein
MRSEPRACGFKNAEGYYVLRYRIVYHSERYGKTKTVEIGYPSDGASGPAPDIYTDGWWVHDPLCLPPPRDEWPKCAEGFWNTDGYWDDGTPCTRWQSSMVLHDILTDEGRWLRGNAWGTATFIGWLPKALWAVLTGHH